MTTSQTKTIDCQVHCYERNRPERPWVGYLQGPDEVTGDDMVAAMDAVGVDGAILISPFSMYRYDASYALEVQAKHPTRFGIVRPFDPHLGLHPRRNGGMDRQRRCGGRAHHAVRRTL